MGRWTRPILGAALAVAAVAALTAASCGLTMATKPAGIDTMISAAKTAADHTAIAARYEEEAAAARAKAEMHGRMADGYRKAGGAAISKVHLDEHCVQLVRIYELAAKENASLAAAHRELAK